MGDGVASRMVEVMGEPGVESTIVFATGATPLPVYRALRERHAAGAASFRHVRAFLLDEYVGLPDGHEQSFAQFMRRHLFDHVDLPEDRFFRPNGRAYDPVEECRRYAESLAAYGPPRLALLGIGGNGHIAFNEPGSPRDSRMRLIALSPGTRTANARFFEGLDQVPKHAVTMGVADILDSRCVVLMATGAGKADILARAILEPATADVPASFLQDYDGEVWVVTDEAAASRLG
jgi:glucosamine-6-phosphate deaminase